MNHKILEDVNLGWIVIMISKCIYFLSRLLGNKGTTISGTVALRLDPFVLKKINKNINTILFVTGTNGKTTTANLLANIMKENGNSVIHNKEGANMLTGITACLIKSANWKGVVTADTAVLEVDEGSLPLVLEQLTPTRIIILNFFRDQLDRFGEIDVLIKSMSQAIKPVETELILNADDPLVMQFDSLGKKSVHFGVQNEALRFGNYAQGESVYCPVCGNELVYRSIHYGQLGDYSCSCGFARTHPKYEVSSAELNQTLCFQMNGFSYRSTLKGNYNIYNSVAAIAAAFESDVEYNKIQQGLSQYSLKNGRMETFYHKGLPYILNLNKNPSGTNVIINEIMGENQPKQLLIILNDNMADGEDISWIWDVDFESLNTKEIEKIICSGSRSSELVLRLTYDNVSNDKIINLSNIHEAIQYSLNHPLQTYILPTYTALGKAKDDLVRKVQPV